MRGWLIVPILVLLAGCGLLGNPEEATEFGSIGSAVPTTEATTTTSRPPSTTVAPSTLYRDLLARTAPADAPPEEPVGEPPYCLDLEVFVFESTQMLLQQDVISALLRHDAALTALDRVASTAPSSVAEPSRLLRNTLASTVGSVDAGAPLNVLEDVVIAMVDGEFGTVFDGLVRDVSGTCSTFADGAVGSRDGVRIVTDR